MCRLGLTAAVFVCVLAFAGAASASTPIVGAAQTSPNWAAGWAAGHGATKLFVSLAPIYWIAAAHDGIRPEVAYAQAALETNYGRHTGVLNPSFHNPCGLKKPQGGGNYNPNAHMRFKTWMQGALAHVDHLALYAGVPGYPRAGSLDPRPFSSLWGTARTAEALGGHWAPSRSYGTRLAGLVHSMLAGAPPNNQPGY